MRTLIGRFGCVAVLTLALVGFARPASADLALFQIGSFESASGDYSYVGGDLTGTTSGTFSYDPAFAAFFSLFAGPYLNSTLEIDAAATSALDCAIVLGVETCGQLMDGFIEIRAADSTLLLRADFSDAIFGGTIGSGSASLSGDTGIVVAGTIIFTSDLFDGTLLLDPKTLNFALTPLSSTLAKSGDNFANFTSPDIANFSATVDVIPEPAMLMLFGLGLTGVGAAVRRRRRAAATKI